MKPFDLETALAGAPVVTRDGREVTQLVRFYTESKRQLPLRGVVEGDIFGWSLSGKWISNAERHADLFMATIPVGKPPMLGKPWPSQGGTYAGLIRGDDCDYHLVVATNEAGKLKGKWGGYGTKITGAESKTDGLANTQAMADAGFELANAAQAVEIEGHKDFYLPSQGELSLIYANAAESFDKEWHWSSTQSSAGYAWVQHFSVGTVLSLGGKDDELRARAVRRIKVEIDV